MPVSWHNHVKGEDYTINPEWMARVREVAQWIVDEGMYFIINIHHDNRLKFLYPDTKHYEQSEKYISAVWSQVAEAFADFDDHCIMESMNEPRLVGSPFEWWLNPNAPECKDAADCINRLADTADNRIMLEVHAYTPYNYALNRTDPDNHFDLDKDHNKKSEIATFMKKLYEKYIKQGIPVIIDEFGALQKTADDLQGRVNFAAYYVASASTRGMTCCWWDNHAFTGNGERFGIIDRRKVEWAYPDIALAILRNCLFNRE